MFKSTVEGCDKYGRVLGSVTCNGKDVGEWLVRNGYAISAYGDKYKDIEREAKLARRGLWGHAEVHDPRAWRHKGEPEWRVASERNSAAVGGKDGVMGWLQEWNKDNSDLGNMCLNRWGVASPDGAAWGMEGKELVKKQAGIFDANPKALGC